jgi:hypothetical protein
MRRWLGIPIHTYRTHNRKGFRRTLFEPELVDPNVEINFVKDSEGCGATRGKFIFESQFTEREII